MIPYRSEGHGPMEPDGTLDDLGVVRQPVAPAAQLEAKEKPLGHCSIERRDGSLTCPPCSRQAAP